MKKLTLILMLFGAVAFGITGCGNSSTESKTEHKDGDNHAHEMDENTHKGHVHDDTTHKEGDGHAH